MSLVHCKVSSECVGFVFCRDRKSIQRRVIAIVWGKCCPGAVQSLHLMDPQLSSRPSVEFSVEFAGGKEAKQPFEIPVTSEEVAQLEIGVGQIERVEEEKVEVEEE